MKKSFWGNVFAGAVGLAMAHSSVANQLVFDFNANLNPPNASVFLFGAAGQTANVTNLAGFNTPVTLSADGFFNLFIPSSFQQSGTGVRNTGFLIDSPQPIAAYFINRASATTDMTYVLDTAALGNSYVVASQGGGFGEGGQIAVHAITNGTNITLTPKGGAPINQTLNAGETFKYAGGTLVDLTGSVVTSNNPVAVFGGHNCAQVPIGTVACDTLLEQMIPTSKLSTDYKLTASKAAEVSSLKVDLVRVVATAPGTVVTRDGAVVATLANIGDVFEFQLAQKTGTRIQTSAPALVAQYLTGAGSGADTDPALALVPGSDTWLKAYRLATPTGAQQFARNFASVVVPTADLAFLTLNGAAVNTAGFTAIAGTTFSRGDIDLPLGLFDLVGPNPFLVMLGGGSSFDSYFTYGGSTFAPGVSPPPDVTPPGPSAPEPGTMGLLGLALAALAWRRRQAKTTEG